MNYLYAMPSRRRQERVHRREIIPAPPVYDRPANRLPCHADADLVQPPVIFVGEPVVFCSGDLIYPLPVDVVSGGAFKPGPKETIKQSGDLILTIAAPSAAMTLRT